MTGEEFQSRLATRAALAGIEVTPDLAEKLEAYYRLLSTWNRRINLTALDLESLPADAVDRLLIEPVAAARYAPTYDRVLDIGSGGGSPAIPFALAAAATELIMVESRVRKSVFLREAARAVGLNHARVLTMRLENASNSSDEIGSVAAITVRAVRLEAEDWPRMLALLKPGGAILFLHRLGAQPDCYPLSAIQQTYPLTATAEVSVWRTPK